jgi:hypothetical protein
MKRPRPRHALAAAAALTALTVPLAGAAFAGSENGTDATSTPGSTLDLDGARARCVTAVDRRLTTLDQLDTRLTEARYVSDEQEAALHESIGAARDGLTALRAEMASDTDRAELRDDCRRIVTDFRVYLLLTPQVRMIGAADSVDHAVARLDGAIADAQAAIDEAAAGGADVTEPTRLLEEVRAATSEADTLADGVIAAVTPLTPADYDAGTAGPVLRSARRDLVTVAKDLRSARADLVQIHRLLR